MLLQTYLHGTYLSALELNLAVISEARARHPPGVPVEDLRGTAVCLGWCWARLGAGGWGAGETSEGAPSPARVSRLTHHFRLPLSGPDRTRDRRNGALGQPTQPRPRPSLTGQALSPLPTGALQIESSEETDQGKYECVATNSAGVRYSSPANLYVRGRERRIQVKGRDPSCPVPPPSLGSQPPGSPVPCRPEQEGPPPPGHSRTLGEAAPLSGPQFLYL